MIRISESAARRIGIGGGRSKFNVDTTDAGKLARTYNGVEYHSGAEMRYAQMLDQRKRVGDIQDWWGQQSIPLRVNGITVCRMVCDFKILHHGGDEIEFVEIKGCETAVFRLKLKLLRAIHPKIRYTVIPAKDIR